MTSDSSPSSSSHRPAALIGWRLLALFYDLWPVVALWMMVSTLFTLGYTFLGNHDAHENIPPYSVLGWLLWLSCWIVAGLYATASWHRGGQTLGMRPWRIRLVALNGDRLTWRQLWVRFAVGTVSLLAAGLGFWWAWFDRDGLTWHDRASRTRVARLQKR